MNPLGIVIGFAIAAVLVAVAGYFGWRQRQTLRMLRADLALARDQRRYLLKQCWRRLFGSLLLVIAAAMLIGVLFLDYEPLEPGADIEAARQSAHWLFAYVTAMLGVVMMILVVALVDFWATARFGHEQRKKLAEEHRALLKADLAQHLRRRAEMN